MISLKALSVAVLKLAGRVYISQYVFEFDLINHTGDFTVNTHTIAGEQFEIDWGDGGESTVVTATSETNYLHTYTGDAATRNIRFIADSSEYIKRFVVTQSGANTSFDIGDLPSGLTYYYNTGSNTTSGNIANLPSGVTHYYNTGSNTTSGDIANLPSGVTHYYNTGSNTTSGDIANLPSGLTWYHNTGSNTTSGNIANLPSGVTYYYNIGSNTTSGNIANLPSGLTYYYNAGSNTTSGDIANLPSGLTWYYNIGSNTTSGNIANLPSGVTYYRNQGSNTVSDYTPGSGGRAWANNFNRMHSVPVSGGLTSEEVDELLIDLANATWGGSSRAVVLTGTNAPRTPDSNDAVAALEAQSVSVTVG
jgi:hypothetical protein